MRIIDVAARIAIEAHRDQKRKSDGFPYIVHPFMVAFLLQKHGFRDEVVAAGLLHDTVEDTALTAQGLQQQVGTEIADMVAALSEDKSLPWEERKRRYIARVATSSTEVKAISTADKISNLSDTLEHFRAAGPAFWEKFTRGLSEQRWYYRAFVTEVGATWTHPLMDELAALVADFEKD